MAKMIPLKLAEEVLTIEDTTPATLNVMFAKDEDGASSPNEGLYWIKVETVTKTAGMTSVAVKWQTAGFRHGVSPTSADNLSTTGTAVTFTNGSAVDMSATSPAYFGQFSLPTDCAIQGSSVNFIHADGVQISLTGQASDDGTVRVSFWTWSY
jgi:hypothetical protein